MELVPFGYVQRHHSDCRGTDNRIHQGSRQNEQSVRNLQAENENDEED